MSIQYQLISFIRAQLAMADSAFVADFVKNGPIPGGRDGGFRYLLAVALHGVSADHLATIAGISPAVAVALKEWLEDGTKNEG